MIMVAAATLLGVLGFWSMTIALLGLTVTAAVLLHLVAMLARYFLESITRLSLFGQAPVVRYVLVWGGVIYLLIRSVGFYLASSDPFVMKSMLLAGFALGLVINDLRQYQPLPRHVQLARSSSSH